MSPNVFFVIVSLISIIAGIEALFKRRRVFASATDRRLIDGLRFHRLLQTMFAKRVSPRYARSNVPRTDGGFGAIFALARKSAFFRRRDFVVSACEISELACEARDRGVGFRRGGFAKGRLHGIVSAKRPKLA
jgi:hypothetical protein